MPDQSQPVDGEISNSTDTQTQTDGATAPQGGASSASPTQDHSGELESLKSQLNRMRDDLDRERETSRLLQQYVSGEQSRKQKSDDDDEYKDVDKALGPWFDKRMKPYVDNLSKVLTEQYDQLDQFGFLAELINSDPELNEKLNPGVPMDEIDRFRAKVAQTEGRYLKRRDALGILRGMRAISEDKRSRLNKKQQAQVDESIRQAAAEATQSGESKPELKSGGGGSKVEALLEKRRSGQRLTDEERATVRKHLENIEL